MTTTTMKAYMHDELPGDQRAPHDSGIPASINDLESLGCLYRSIDSDDEIDAVSLERGYKHRDVVVVDEEKMGGAETYAAKLKMFYAEHLHDDEEIRYILDGEGYFDVRSNDDKWIRVLLEKNDLLVLPAGIYHRFTPAYSDYVKALRLFKDEPKWTAYPRPADDHVSRKNYLASVGA